MNGTRTAGLVLALLLPLSAGAAAPTVADRYRDSYAHEAKGELTEALAEIDALPKAQRQTYVYQLRRGWLLYLLGRYWDSLEAYRAAAKLRPKAIEPQLGMMLPEAALLLWLDVLETGRRIRDRAPHDYLATSRMAPRRSASRLTISTGKRERSSSSTRRSWRGMHTSTRNVPSLTARWSRTSSWRAAPRASGSTSMGGP